MFEDTSFQTGKILFAEPCGFCVAIRIHSHSVMNGMLQETNVFYSEEYGGRWRKPASANVFDTKALNGLRGFAAFHICIFHVLFYSTLNINVYAGVRLSSGKQPNGFPGLSWKGRKVITPRLMM